MNTQLFFKFLTIVLGYALIIAGFIIFGESLATDIKVLDIIVSCFIHTQFVLLFIFPMIDLSRKVHKEVGMMGIYYYVLNVFCLASIVFMVLGIVFDIAFKYQMMVQLFFLFFFLAGIVATLHSGEKVEKVYAQEHSALRGRDSMKMAMNDFMDELALCRSIQLEPQLFKRLQAIQENVRYMSPSSDERASDIEEKFRQTLSAIKVLLRDVGPNASRIDAEVTHLEQIVRQRKNYTM